jgi:histone H3/H4
MKALQVVAERSSGAARRRARQSGSLLPARIDRALRAVADAAKTEGDPATALRNTVEAIWTTVTQAVSEPALEPSRHTVRALLARRELVQRGTRILSAVIRRGVESGAFRPRCVPWASERLPFAIVRGACVHWMFGLSKRPSLRAGTAVAAALEILRAETYNLEGKTLP